MAIEFPITVTGIDFPERKSVQEELLFGGKCGDFVAVRPCREEYGGKTFLGVLIGEVALTTSARWDPESQRLEVSPALYNPAIFVPDLKCLIYGHGSWWGRINSPDDLRQITDADIDNVWYVQALKSLEKSENETET